MDPYTQYTYSFFACYQVQRTQRVGEKGVKNDWRYRQSIMGLMDPYVQKSMRFLCILLGPKDPVWLKGCNL